MRTLLMRDVSAAGHELGRAELTDLPATLELRELLRRRIRADVSRYNADPGPVFAGLVQPADAIRHSDGHHLPTPRQLDAELLIAAAEEAVAAGILSFELAGETTSDLHRALDELREVVAVLRRPVVARAG